LERPMSENRLDDSVPPADAAPELYETEEDR
jgi:hypothetical protein